MSKLEQELNLNPEDATKITGLIVGKHIVDSMGRCNRINLVVEDAEGRYIIQSHSVYKLNQHTEATGPGSSKGLCAMLDMAIRSNEEVTFTVHQLQENNYLMTKVKFSRGFEYILFWGKDENN